MCQLFSMAVAPICAAQSPAYTLELLANIGVLQLLVSLPPGTSGVLPPTWQPGVRLTDGAAAEARAEQLRLCGAGSSGGSACARPPLSLLELAFDLPGAGACALAVPLPARVESAKCVATACDDHICLRLPLYYSGAVSQRPERARAAVTPREVAALCAAGRALSCRACRAPLIAGGGGGSCSGGGGFPPLTAAVLPSEYWLDLSDLWLCHGDQTNALIPAADFGARGGSLLVAETALQVHPADALPGAQAVVPREGTGTAARGAVLRAVAEDEAAAVMSAGAGARGSGTGSGSVAPFPVACARCAATLGSVQLPEREGGAALTRLATAPPKEAAAAADTALQYLPPRLAKDVDPYLSLLKEALWLPDEAAGAASSATNALRAYTPVTRVAETLLAALQANGQYSFVLSSGGGGGGPTPLHLTVSSWGGKFAHGGGTLRPALRVHYAPAGADAGVADVRLPPADFAAVAAALLASTAALPPSRRRVGAAWLGFLPLAAAEE